MVMYAAWKEMLASGLYELQQTPQEKTGSEIQEGINMDKSA